MQRGEFYLPHPRFRYPEQASKVFAAMDEAYREATVTAGVSTVPRILLQESFDKIVDSLDSQSDDDLGNIHHYIQ